MAPGPLLKALLLADLVDSTGLVRRLGDAGAADFFARHDRLARDLLAADGGREIDKADGFLLLFDRPFGAVHFALRYHEALAGLTREAGAQVAARVGIHVGEVYLRENSPEDVARGAKPLEVEGLAKPMVARLVSLASGRQTLLSRTAFDLCRRAAVGEKLCEGEVRWLAHGDYRFQGVDEPVAVFEVGAVGRAPLSAPGDSDKARREVLAGDEITLGWRPAAGQEVPGRPRWLLTQRLGEGGFGEVWLAARRNTGEKRVFKFCYQAEELRALRREVTVFRLLKEVLGNREDIARIIDWNFDQAPYFLESEYTEGGSLVDWAAEQGGIDRVPLPTRLELIAQVAEALAAAHSVGVLHKDVKPANVLITRDADGAPRARLTDFGVGLITDSRLLADRGITVFGLTELQPGFQEPTTGGTHLYMAPEVLEGKPPTVQADVYALGVMLYQVVVGDLNHALAPGWQRDVEDELLAADIAGFVDGSPARRPGSALEVAERLRSLEERRQKLHEERRARAEAERSRRRRRLFATIATVATVFLVVVSLLALQALKERRVAEQRREQAEELVSFMVGDLQAKLDPVSRREVLGEIADKVLAYFDALPKEDLSDSELFRRSKALDQIGQVRSAEGDLPAALAAFQEALDLGEDLRARGDARPEWLQELGASHYWVGYVLRAQGDLEGALRHWQSYLDLSEELAARDPDNTDWQLEVAYSHHNLGFLLRDRGDLQGALERLEAALGIERKLVQEHPERPELGYDLAKFYNAVGSVLEEMGRLGDALERYRSEVSLKQDAVERNPDSVPRRSSLAIGHNYLGKLLEAMGQPGAALTEYRAAVALLTEPAAKDPENAGLQRDLAINGLRIARGILAQGDAATALARARSAQEVLQEIAAKDPTNRYSQQDLARSHLDLARILEAQRHLAEAMAECAAAQKILEPLVEQQPSDRVLVTWLSRCYLLEGTLHEHRGEREEARSAWGRAADAIGPFARTSSDYQILAPWAQALLHLDRLAEARPVVERLAGMGFREAGFLSLCREKNLL
jgi:serine/threonine protein kinase/class 3 adenylate cyclase